VDKYADEYKDLEIVILPNSVIARLKDFFSGDLPIERKKHG